MIGLLCDTLAFVASPCLGIETQKTALSDKFCSQDNILEGMIHSIYRLDFGLYTAILPLLNLLPIFDGIR